MKYSMWITVNNIVITMYGARGILGLSEGSLGKLHKCITVMVQTGLWLLGALTHDQMICVEGNRFLLTGFQACGG